MLIPVAVPLSRRTVATRRVTAADQWRAHDVSVTRRGCGNYRAGGRCHHRSGRLAGYHRQRRSIHPLNKNIQSLVNYLLTVQLKNLQFVIDLDF